MCGLARNGSLAMWVGWSFKAYGAAGHGEGQKSPQSHHFHIMVFEARSDALIPEGESYHARNLPSGEFPEAVSTRLFYLPAMQSSIDLTDYGLPRVSYFLDVFSRLRIAATSRRPERFSHRNRLSDLRYRVDRLVRHERVYSMRLSPRYQGRTLSGAEIEAPVDRTTVVAFQLEGDRVLLFALTWTDAIPIVSTRLFSGSDPRLQFPTVVRQEIPPYPRELAARRPSSMFLVAAIVTAEGDVDRSRFVFLRCDHLAFARVSLEVILMRWKFEPGLFDGVPASVLATIEVTFR